MLGSLAVALATSAPPSVNTGWTTSAQAGSPAALPGVVNGWNTSVGAATYNRSAIERYLGVKVIDNDTLWFDNAHAADLPTFGIRATHVQHTSLIIIIRMHAHSSMGTNRVPCYGDATHKYVRTSSYAHVYPPGHTQVRKRAHSIRGTDSQDRAV